MHSAQHQSGVYASNQLTPHEIKDSNIIGGQILHTIAFSYQPVSIAQQESAFFNAALSSFPVHVSYNVILVTIKHTRTIGAKSVAVERPNGV